MTIEVREGEKLPYVVGVRDNTDPTDICPIAAFMLQRDAIDYEESTFFCRSWLRYACRRFWWAIDRLKNKQLHEYNFQLVPGVSYNSMYIHKEEAKSEELLYTVRDYKNTRIAVFTRKKDAVLFMAAGCILHPLLRLLAHSGLIHISVPWYNVKGLSNTERDYNFALDAKRIVETVLEQLGPFYFDSSVEKIEK